jgi:hypothetical protein
MAKRRRQAGGVPVADVPVAGRDGAGYAGGGPVGYQGPPDLSYRGPPDLSYRGPPDLSYGPSDIRPGKASTRNYAKGGRVK